MRIVFFGSPSFAVPTLEALRAAGHDVALVVSQPGKPVGRKAEITDPPVASLAKSLGMLVFQPPTLKDDAAFARLAEARADAFVVAAYGKILAQRVLDLPRLGCLNVHGSLLPRWRGASPVQASILAGDPVTGVSIMKMEAGMDTGPVYAMRKTEIGEEETAEMLGARLATLGAQALIETLFFLEGEEGRSAGSPGRFARHVLPEDRPGGRARRLDAARGRAGPSGAGLHPLARPLYHSKKCAREAVSASLSSRKGRGREREQQSLLLPARCSKPGARVVVACGEGAVAVATLQAEGRKALPAADFVRGERVAAGETWGG